MRIRNSYYIFPSLFSIFIIGLILYLNAPKKEGFLPNLPDDRDTCFMAGGSWMRNECMIILPHPAFKSKSSDSPSATVCPPCPAIAAPVAIAPAPNPINLRPS